MVWEALDGAAVVRAAMRFLGRHWKSALVVLALAPLACAPFVKIAPTGDEPTYLFFADSLIRDGDLQFPPQELRSLNQELGLWEGHEPHTLPRAGGGTSPRHHLGPSLVVVPVVAVVRALGLPLMPVVRGFMLAMCGVTLVLTAWFAARALICVGVAAAGGADLQVRDGREDTRAPRGDAGCGTGVPPVMPGAVGAVAAERDRMGPTAERSDQRGTAERSDQRVGVKASGLERDGDGCSTGVPPVALGVNLPPREAREDTRAPRGAAILATIIIAVSFPMLGMSCQLYPDPMVAPLVLAALIVMSPAFRDGGSLRGTRRGVGGLRVLPAAVVSQQVWRGVGRAFRVRALVSRAVAAARPPRAGGVVLAGVAVYLAVNVPVIGRFLWAQAEPDYPPLEGIVAMFADSHSGLIVYAPWVLALPCGAWAMRRGGGRGRLAAAVVSVTLAVWIPSGALTWEGLATALRYLTPLVVAWAPWLAAALIAMRGRRLAALAACCAIPVLMVSVFVADPMTAFMPGKQGMRLIGDAVLSHMSYRELFAPFRLVDQGVNGPHALAHGAAVLAVAGLVAAVLARARRDTWAAVAALAAGIVALAALGRAFDSPNWTVTASRMFERQCRSADALAAAAQIRRASPPCACSFRPRSSRSSVRVGRGWSAATC